MFEMDDNVIINSVFRERTSLVTIAGSQESFFDKTVWADQQSVARERRQGLVRRISVTRRTEWKRLPPGLTRFLEAVHHRECGWAYIANTVRRPERRDVHQHARGLGVRCERGEIH